MKARLTVFGCGGHATVVYDAAGSQGAYDVVAFVDDTAAETTFHGLPVHMSIRDVEAEFFVVGFGALDDLTRRGAAFREAEEAGLRAASVIHPSATVSGSANIGDGCFIASQAHVGPEAALGENCIVNTSAIVEHGCQLGDGVFVGSNAALTGESKVGAYALIGAGAVVLPGIQIGRDAVIGAGAVVTKDVPQGAVMVGNPARVMKKG